MAPDDWPTVPAALLMGQRLTSILRRTSALAAWIARTRRRAELERTGRTLLSKFPRSSETDTNKGSVWSVCRKSYEAQLQLERIHRSNEPSHHPADISSPDVSTQKRLILTSKSAFLNQLSPVMVDPVRQQQVWRAGELQWRERDGFPSPASNSWFHFLSQVIHLFLLFPESQQIQ